jgi:hypothetical protein
VRRKRSAEHVNAFCDVLRERPTFNAQHSTFNVQGQARAEVTGIKQQELAATHFAHFATLV